MYRYIFLFLFQQIPLPRRLKGSQVNKNVLILTRDKTIVLLTCEMDQVCPSGLKSELSFTFPPLKFLIIRSSLEEKCAFVWEQIIEKSSLALRSQSTSPVSEKRCTLKMERLVVTGYFLKFISFYIFCQREKLSVATYTASVSILFLHGYLRFFQLVLFQVFFSLMSELLTTNNFPLFSSTQCNL